MKAISRTIIIICIFMGASPELLCLSSKSGLMVRRRSSVMTEDTARISRMMDEGFMLTKKSRKETRKESSVDKIGTLIDSITYLYEKNKLEYSPRLHLMHWVI